MKTKRPRKRMGPLPKRGLPAALVVTARLNVPEMKAMKVVMKQTGIATRSQFVAAAVRHFVQASGIDIQGIDPRQGLLPVVE